MIECLIWSKDRACQLDFLLRSMQKYAKSLFPVVLYKASTDEYKAGYQKLKDSGVHAHLWEESNLHHDSIEIISNYFKYENVTWSTDDMVFYREVPTIPLVKVGETFSLRYGLNTTLQFHVTGERQPPLNRYFQNGEIISWNPFLYSYPQNYSYSLACDLHIYNRQQLLHLITRFPWKNTNELEGGLQNFRAHITTISSFTQSCCFNIAANNLSGYTVGGAFHPYTTEELNRLYLDGKSISFKTIENFKPDGCHHELPLVIE